MKYSTFLFIIILLFSCSTQTQVSKTGEFIPPEQEGLADSLKFFPIDTLQSKPIRLIDDHTEIQVPEQNSDKTGNYRVQIYASSKRELASAEADKALLKQRENVFITRDGELWKVQVGDFATKPEAERAKNSLHDLGWKDSWIIDMRRPAIHGQSITKPPKKPVPAEPENTVTQVFKIQILATNKKEAADEMLSNVKKLGILKASIEQEAGYWKVRIGEYPTKQDARNDLGKIKDIGFVDAWIVSSTGNSEKIINKKEAEKNVLYSIELGNTILKKDSEQIINQSIQLLGVKPELMFYQSLWRVRYGKFNDWEKVNQELERIKRLGFQDAFIVEEKDNFY